MHDSMESRRENIETPDATIDFGVALYRLKGLRGYHCTVRYQVIPAGREFFHVREAATGRVLGFRQHHLAACELARQLENTLKDFVAPPIQ
ncbi:hypothetical protein [Pseudomonas putida]